MRDRHAVACPRRWGLKRSVDHTLGLSDQAATAAILSSESATVPASRGLPLSHSFSLLAPVVIINEMTPPLSGLPLFAHQLRAGNGLCAVGSGAQLRI